MAGPPGEKVTITKKALEGLKARAAKAEQSEREAKAAKKALKTVENEAESADKDYSNLKKEYDDLAADAKQKALIIEALQQQASAIAVTTAVSGNGRGKSKVTKKDLNQELVNHVTQTAKTVLFRTWKFIEDALEEEEVTKELIPYLPVETNMSDEEFVANYSNVVYEAIKNARTEVQSNGKKRAKELYDICKNLPKTEQLLQILAMDPEDLEKKENALPKSILTWYTDRWMPIVVGNEYWDDNQRHYKLPTDTCKIAMRDGSEEERVRCTISSEAFGLLVYDNCQEKWENILKLKAANPGAVIPRKGEEAKPYLAKWTLTKEGQKKYGGWKPEGMDRFGVLQDTLEDLRNKDGENGKVFQKYCMKIVRELHKIPENATNPDDAANAAKKRARTPTPPPIDPSKRKVKRRRE